MHAKQRIAAAVRFASFWPVAGLRRSHGGSAAQVRLTRCAHRAASLPSYCAASRATFLPLLHHIAPKANARDERLAMFGREARRAGVERQRGWKGKCERREGKRGGADRRGKRARKVENGAPAAALNAQKPFRKGCRQSARSQGQFAQRGREEGRYRRGGDGRRAATAGKAVGGSRCRQGCGCAKTSGRTDALARRKPVCGRGLG